MNRSFGPWSTAIATGANPELNTFWKRRLAMLPLLGQTASRVSRRTILLLGVLAALGLAIPTLKWAGHFPIGNAAAQGAGDEANSGGGARAAAFAGAGEDADVRSEKKKAAADAVPEYLPRPTKEEEKFLATLARRIDVDFSDVPLDEC